MLRTRHGNHRARKRLGLPKKAVEKEVARALVYGLRIRDVEKSALRSYMTMLHARSFDEHRKGNTDVVLYGNFIYIFAGASKDILLTTWPVPSRFQQKRRVYEIDVDEEEVA